MAKNQPNRAKDRKTAAAKKSSADDVSRWKVARVCIGMFLLLFSVFLIAAFASYIFDGKGDQSIAAALYDSNSLSGQKVQNIGGNLGLYLSYFFINGCFGLASFFIPVFGLLLALNLIGSFHFKLFKNFVRLAGLMVWLCIVLGVVGARIPTEMGLHFNLGGNVGASIQRSLNSLVGEVGEIGGVGLTILFVLIYFSAKTVDRIVEFFKFQRVKDLRDKLKREENDPADAAENELDALAGGGDAAWEADKAADEENEEMEVQANEFADASEDSFESDADSAVALAAAGALGATDGASANGEPCFVIEGLGEPLTPELDGDDFSSSSYLSDNAAADDELAAMFDRVAGAHAGQAGVGASVAAATGEGVDASSQQDGPAFTIDATNEPEKGGASIERGGIETPYDPRLDLSRYQFPPLELLAHDDSPTSQINLEEQTRNKENITRVLKAFGVDISSIRATIGPTVTLYEITLAEGVRISKVKNLQDDIALSIAAQGIRIIAPIPGKGTIGIEVPNKTPQIVSMHSILDSRIYKESKMELPCALGKTITNDVFMMDLAKAPHLLIAGATGMGKSVGLNVIITSLLYKKHPSELKLVLVDPKKVEFSIYSPIANQYLAKLEDEPEAVITENQRVIKTLNALCKLMDDRYLLLKDAHVRNIKEYNEKFKARRLNPLKGHEYMPYYVVVIDEYGDLIMTAGKEIELPICRIAQLARAVGIHMILATQRPTAKIVTGAIKANFPARMAFKVSAMMDSRIILDRPGAEQLVGKGDMLFLSNADPVRVQCAFVDTPEVNAICDFIEEQQKFPEMTFLPEPPMDESEGAQADVDTRHLDNLFPEVAQFVVANQQGSTSAIQRKWSIGYNRAGRLMDQLEKTGVVGPQQGSKPREVLISDLVSLDGLLNALGVGR